MRLPRLHRFTFFSWTKSQAGLLRWLSLILVSGVLVACQSGEKVWSPTEEQIRRNNEGVALMGQYQNEPARQVFASLLEEAPDWTDVRVNLAIATLNRQQENDELRALEIVESVLESHPSHSRARYIAGLMRFYIGESEAALAHFNRLLEQVGDDAHVLYFTAQALGQLGQHEKALALYQQAIEIDPYLRSAYYGAALTLRTLGQSDQAREQLAIYQRFANNPRAHLAEFRYTRKGVLAEALAIGNRSPAEDLAVREGELFAVPTLLGLIELQQITSLVTADINDDGWQDLMIAGGENLGNEIWLGHAEGWTKTEHPLSTIKDVMAAGFADINNDGELDVYLCRQGANQWVSATTAQRLAGADDIADEGHCQDLAIVDADHDGDLDVVVINQSGGHEIFNNNLNGTFRRLSQAPESNFTPSNQPGRGLVAADLDGDRDLDLMALHQSPPHQVWANDRLWQYQADQSLNALISSDVVELVAGDLQADGGTDLVVLNSAGELVHWTRLGQEDWINAVVANVLSAAQDPEARSGLAMMDIDGDGRLDLLVHDTQGFEVFQWSEDQRTLESRYRFDGSIESLLPVVHEVSLGPSVIGVRQESVGWTLNWWAPGRARYNFVGIEPTGKSSTADGMRSNASGLGTQLVARVGQHWTVLDKLDDYSGPGQSDQPLVLGLGERDFADFIKLYWSDGVLQTEMALEAGKVHRVEEYQRQLASCPVLFAWNGERFDFVSDILGVGGIGFFQSPGQYAEPRPWEYFRFPTESAKARDGYYPIKITEPMQEIAYIDATWLHVYDLPSTWAVAMDERMHTGGGPKPEGVPIFYQPSKTLWPKEALNDRGEQVLETLVEVDNVAAEPGPRDTRFLGRLAEPHVLELDFGTVINPPNQIPVLWASGWVEYPYSQTVFAAWQAEATYQSPSIYAYSEGEWVLVYESFGYPAGMPREMTLPLNDLPPKTTKLRIEGNLEIYWDAVAVINAEPMPKEAKHYRLEAAEARLSKTGFARRDTLDQRRPYYDYDDRKPYWDTHYQSGFYTRLGPVMELVSSHNNAFAIIGPGEELHLEFESPTTSPLLHRTLVLETRGYAKDKDLYTKDGATVGPLPFSSEVGQREQSNELHARYMTRYQGGF